MPIDWDAGLLAPSEAAFGIPVTYLAGDGRVISTGPDGTPLLGIFNDRWSTTSFQDNEEVRSGHPMVSVRASRLPQAPVQGELFRINGKLYQVTETDPDGMGDLRVHLRAATDTDASRVPLPST